MRMWNVNPRIMCRNHLLGEHLEMHMFVGCLNKGKSIEGYLDGLLEIHNLKKRHRELVKEMGRRGYNHNSPLPKFKVKKRGKINSKKSRKELLKRCKKCGGKNE
jgi:hypothetical protein